MLTKAPCSASEDYWLPPLHRLMDCGTFHNLLLLMHKDFEYLLSAVMRQTTLPTFILGCIFLAQAKLFMLVLFPVAKARNRKELFHLIAPCLTGLF